MAPTRRGNDLSKDLSNGLGNGLGNDLGNDRAAPGPEIAAAPDTSRSPLPHWHSAERKAEPLT